MPYEVFLGCLGLSGVFDSMTRNHWIYHFFNRLFFYCRQFINTLLLYLDLLFKKKKKTCNWFKGIYCPATTRRDVTYEGCGEEMILLSLSPSPSHYPMPKCKEVQPFKLSHIPPSSLLVVAGQHTWLSK